MGEKNKTVAYAGVALFLVLLAVVTAPRSVTPDSFLDRGEPFYPEFTDPNTATTLEVIEFDEETAEARPFKVTFKDGRWTIPSHHDYPADGKDRLAQTAAGILEITKDDFRSDNVSDHELCGVIDPLDEEATTLRGRGKRVTIRGEGDQVLADLIIGKKIEEREQMHFVRVPGQKRVYAASVNVEISTRFEDWIEQDLLQVEKDAITEILLKDYTINERTGSINQRDTLTLSKDDDAWKADRMRSTEEVNSSKMDGLLRAIDELNIVGVRVKPEGLSRSLSRSQEGGGITQRDVLSLQSKGFYFTRNGSLVSNEGELLIKTEDGLTYTLRFGEVLYGRGEAVTAGTESSDSAESGPGENRYLFVTTAFDPSLFPEPPRPDNTDFENKQEENWTDSDRRNKEIADRHREWAQKTRRGQELSDQLNGRFARWYYVISADSFEKIRLERGELVQKKES